MLRVGKHAVLLSSIGAIPLFSGAERYFRTESESPWVTCAACSGRRKVDLVERNASVALKTAVTEIRDSEERERRGRTHGVAKWHRRKSVVFGSGALFPYGERVSLGQLCGLQWAP